MQATAEIKEGKLVITIPCNVVNPPDSASGKTRLVASTNGNQTTAFNVLGKPLVIGLNAWIKK